MLGSSGGQKLGHISWWRPPHECTKGFTTVTEMRALKKGSMVLWVFVRNKTVWQVRKGFLEEVTLGLSSEKLSSVGQERQRVPNRTACANILWQEDTWSF